jgi:Flp pilus assembly pilin Flp
MLILTKLFVRFRYCRAQAMTEYALILAAVAVAVFVTYQIMGQDINSLVGQVDNILTAT